MDGATLEEYRRDGKRHREDGPAVVQRETCGIAETYYLDGVERSKDEYDAELNPLLTGLRLPLANGGLDAVDALLREAIAEQSAPGKPNGRELIVLC
jgi:hypothetical protein